MEKIDDVVELHVDFFGLVHYSPEERIGEVGRFLSPHQGQKSSR